MRAIAIAATIWIVLGIGPGPVGAKPGDLGPDNVVARFLEDCIVGPGREYRALAVFPITLDGPVRTFPSVPLGEAYRKDEVALAEGKRLSSIRGLGFGLETVLLLTGDVVAGGRVDRMIAQTTAIRPRTDGSLAVIPVEKVARNKDKKTSFEPTGLLAPPYLRMAIHRGDPQPAVARLLDHYDSVLPDDVPSSLVAVMRSERMQFLAGDYVLELGGMPAEAGGRVLGVVGVVGEKVVLWEAFGSPALFRSHWPKILASLAFAAAGDEIRAGTAGQPVLQAPPQGPARFVPALTSTRTRLAGAKIRPGKSRTLSGLFGIEGPRLVGSAVTGPAGIAHLVAFPRYPGDDARYEKNLPPETDPEDLEYDPVVLLRREREGRLTAAEQRYLDRLRRRRRPGEGPELPRPDGPGGGLPEARPRPGPVRPGDLPGSDRPDRPPAPDPNPPPPPPKPGGGGGGGGGGREDLPPAGGR